MSSLSEYIYGGYQHVTPNPDSANADTYVLPTEWRPYNKYLAPGMTGRSPIKIYVCPSDKSFATPTLGQHDPPQVDTRYSSWEVNGNSYPINWYWPGGWGCDYAYRLPLMTTAGAAMLSKKVGGAAAEFIIFMESMMNAYMYDATPLGSDPSPWPLGVGWHRKLSVYSAGFFDGHTEYRNFDTRWVAGTGWNTWPQVDTAWPSCTNPCAN